MDDEATRSRGRLVVITGLPGSGKTTLAIYQPPSDDELATYDAHGCTRT